MPGLDTGINLYLATNVASFKRDMAEASGAVRGFGSSVVGTYKSINAAGAALGAISLAVGAGLSAVALGLAQTAAGLETAMTNVATIWDEEGQKLEGTFLDITTAGKQVVDLSTRLPQTAEQLAAGLYEVASSGFQGTEGMRVLEVSANAASAGLTDTATAVRAVTAVLNAYGDGAEQAAHVSDVMFEIVNQGVVTFEELAQNMGDIAPIAASANVAFEDAGAAFAAMTLTGLPATEAATSLSGVIRGLIDPSEAMTAKLQELGYESGTMALETLGLKGTLDLLNEATGGQADAWVQLFTDYRAARGAMAATADEGQNLAEVNEAIAKASEDAGATEEALTLQAETLNFQMQTLRNTVTALSIEFGQAMLPVVKAVTGVLQSFTEIFRAIPDSVKEALVIMGTFLGVMVTLGGIWISHKLTIGLFEASLNLASAAMVRLGVTASVAGVAVRGLSLAMNAMKISLGVIGVALAVASVAMTIWGDNQEENTEGANSFKDSLDKETGAVNDNTAALVRNKAEKDGLADKIRGAGLNLEDYIAAVVGDTAAAERFNAALAEQERLTGAVATTTGTTTTSMNSFGEALSDVPNKESADDLKDIREGLEKTTGEVKEAGYQWHADRRAKEANRKITQNLTGATIDLTEAEKGLVKALQGIFDPAKAYEAAMKAGLDAIDKRAEKEADARELRHDAESDALDDQLELEREGLDDLQEQRDEALEKRHEAEINALDKIEEAEKDSLDRRQEEQMRAWEEQAETRKEALDDQQEIEVEALDDVISAEKDALAKRHRLQKQALDARLALLDDEYDKRRRTAEREYEAQKAELEWIIGQTWGAERRAAIERLAILEESHHDRLDALDREQDAEETTLQNALADEQDAESKALDDRVENWKDALADRHEAEDEALDDLLDLEKQGLKDIHDAEDRALKDRQELRRTAITTRHTEEKDALDDLKEQEDAHFRDREKALTTSLQNRQTAENNAAAQRVEQMKENFKPTYAEWEAQLLKMEEAQKTTLENIEKIIELGGPGITEKVKEVLGTLTPEAIALIANAGPEGVRQFVEAVKGGFKDLDPKVLAVDEKGKEIGGEFAGGLLAGIGEFLGLPPGVDPFGGLIAPPAPRAPGDLRPLVRPANGGIWQFADGGEYHVAQIAPAGSWRLWAEPETGGEAYIPMAYSKRARSTSILAQVASAFGYGLIPMANGGVAGGSGGGGGPTTISMPIHVEARVEAGIDMGRAGQVISREIETGMRRAFDQLGRQVVVKAWRN